MPPLAALDVEFAAAALDADGHADLRRRGIPWPLTYLVGRGTVEWLDGGLYSPVPNGSTAWIIACRRDPDEIGFETLSPEAATVYGDTVDLVAVEPGRGGRIATRRGAVAVLGNVGPQIFQPEPVPVWRSPWGWLKAGGVGLVLLSTDALDRWRVLSSLGAIVAEDVAHGRELERLLKRPFRHPPVLVRDQAQHAGRQAA